MNRNFSPTSPLLRSLFVAAAIDGLATHCTADTQQVKATATVIARR